MFLHFEIYSFFKRKNNKSWFRTRDTSMQPSWDSLWTRLACCLPRYRGTRLTWVYNCFYFNWDAFCAVGTCSLSPTCESLKLSNTSWAGTHVVIATGIFKKTSWLLKIHNVWCFPTLRYMYIEREKLPRVEFDLASPACSLAGTFFGPDWLACHTTEALVKLEELFLF